MARPINNPVYFEDLTYKIIGLAINVHNELGSIHKETIYQTDLKIALEMEKISFEREVRLPVLFQGKNVGIYVPDFIIENKVIVEVKALEVLPVSASFQISYYLKSTGYKIGLLINFGTSKLQVKRRIYG